MDKIEDINLKLKEIEEEKEIIKEEQKKMRCILHLIRGQLNYLLSKIIKYESGSDTDEDTDDFNYLSNESESE